MNEQQKQALLDQLQGVHTPQVSWVPAIGWWLLAVVLVVLLYGAFRWLRFYRARRWQREAKAELARLRSQLLQQPAAQTLSDTSRLARRVLLASHLREDVAALQGQAWLDALDTVCKRPLFATGFGRLLEAGPYQRDPQVTHQDLASLLDAMDVLIRSAGSARVSSI